MNNEYPYIPKEKLEFAPPCTQTGGGGTRARSRGYLADALLRFKNNRSSVVAAWIIGFLIIFSIFAPILSLYSVEDKDSVYQAYPPFIESIAEMRLGIFDGSAVRKSQSELQMNNLYAIGRETGRDPITKIIGTSETTEIYRGEERTTHSYEIRVNRYYEKGVIFKVLSYEEFESIKEWQNETGIQVIYPYVEQKNIYINHNGTGGYPLRNANIWYVCKDSRNNPLLDQNGNLIPAYSTDKSKEGEYNSLRIEGDDGSLIYSAQKSGAVECRIGYYNYYCYLNGHAPCYPMGTDSYGRDLFCAIGMGARFSLLLAFVVSIINLAIGAIYGAVAGFYGGGVDLVLDRISDILSGVPYIVVVTLFQLHLASRVGTVAAFLFAFVLTGWISTAALTRKQFYRYKGREYVLASRALGASDRRLMFKHIFPNAIGTIITGSILIIPGVISNETALTYLGIIDISDFTGTSIGELMASGQQSMTGAAHAMLFPALFVSLLLISFNLFGNGLRDALNPSTRGALE